MEENRNHHRYRIIGIALALSAVVLGAFGAHMLKDILTASSTFSIWETAVRYQMWHALALLAISLFPERHTFPKATVPLLIAGTLFFSGSLYALATGAPAWIGPITPIGGLCLITGWSLLLFSVYKNCNGCAQFTEE